MNRNHWVHTHATSHIFYILFSELYHLVFIVWCTICQPLFMETGNPFPVQSHLTQSIIQVHTHILEFVKERVRTSPKKLFTFADIPPVLYKVVLWATFWNMNYSVLPVWTDQGDFFLSISEQLLRVFFSIFCMQNYFLSISEQL